MPAKKAHDGKRLEALVLREHDKLRELEGEFQDAWSRRETVRSLYSFQRFREALIRHLKWEEGPLFTAYAKRAAAGEPHGTSRHRRQHLLIRKVCVDVLELIARRLMMGSAVDDDIADRLAALDQLLERHRDGETFEICAVLDGALGKQQLEAVAGELEGAAATEDVISRQPPQVSA